MAAESLEQAFFPVTSWYTYFEAGDSRLTARPSLLHACALVSAIRLKIFRVLIVHQCRAPWSLVCLSNLSETSHTSLIHAVALPWPAHVVF